MKCWNLISLENARKMAVECMINLPRRTELVALQEALGRITAGDVVNREDNPAFDRSTMDGYALQSSDTRNASAETPAHFAVIGEVRMGKPAGITVNNGQAVRIPTGGMLPVGADTVMMQENTRRSGAKLEVLQTAGIGENIIRQGSDAKTGEVIVGTGCRLGAPDLGVLASCGVDQVKVMKKPIVTVITTGDEIVPPHAIPLPGQIRDVNSYTLFALAEAAGCEVQLTERIPDSLEELLAMLKAAVSRSDIVLVSGGSSVGDRDFTTQAVQALPDIKVLFHGIALKPGKPTLMALAGNTVLFGIPGNTVAAMTVFREIVEPAVAAWQGDAKRLPQFVVRARLGASIRPDSERTAIFRVRLEQKNGELVAWPLSDKSGLITVMTRAHGEVRTEAGQAQLQTGESVNVRLAIDRVGGIWEGAVQ